MVIEKYVLLYSEERWNRLYKVVIDHYWPQVKGLNINTGAEFPKDISRVIQCYYRSNWREWYSKSNPDLDGQSMVQVLKLIPSENNKTLFLKGFLIGSFERIMYLK